MKDLETNKQTKKPKNPVEQINKSKCWFFERRKKIDKLITRLTIKKRKRTQIDKITNDRGEITANTTEIPTL